MTEPKLKQWTKQWTRIITFTGDEEWIDKCYKLSWITGNTTRNMGNYTIEHSEVLTTIGIIDEKDNPK